MCLFTAPSFGQSPSPFAKGSWGKLTLQHEGVHVLTHHDLLEIFSSTSLPHKHLAIFVFNGASLVEVPIQIKSADDLWSAGDSLFFYAPSKQQLAASNGGINPNVFDDETFAFVTALNQNGQRITIRDSSCGIGTVSEPLILREGHYDANLLSIIKSGANLLGETISEESPRWHVPFPIDSLQQLRSITISAVSRATVASKMYLLWNDDTLGVKSFPPTPSVSFGKRGTSVNATFSFDKAIPKTNSTGRLAIAYDQIEAGYELYLDKVEAQWQTLLKNPKANFLAQVRCGNAPCKVTHAHTLPLWEVSNPFHPSLISDTAFCWDEDGAVWAQNTSSFLVPKTISQLPKNDILQAGGVELLIIAPPLLFTAAEQLAQHRRIHDKLTVKTVSVSDVYNLFSGGRRNPEAIRRYIQTLKQNNATGLKYVLLFGEASYLLNSSHNALPTYASPEFLHNVLSYATDDYYGITDSLVVSWRADARNIPLNVAIGRLPVANTGEAEQAIKKIIHYDTSRATLGNWRSRVLFFADDGDQNKFQLQSEYLSDAFAQTQEAFTVSKLYIDAFPKVKTPYYWYAKQANTVLKESLEEKGALWIDYLGHGGETGLTNERAFDVSDLDEWDYPDKLPIWVTSTCEFGRYDDHARKSTAEQALLHQQGGAMAVFTNTRPGYIATNFSTSHTFHQSFEELRQTKIIRMGDLLLNTKNRLGSDPTFRNFILLGDPSQRLAIPSFEVKFDALPTGVSRKPIQLKGHITNRTQTIQAVDGTLIVNVLSSPVPDTTLGFSEKTMVYHQYDQIIANIKLPVSKGKFDADIILPDPPKNNDSVTLKAYFHPKTGLVDGMGTDKLHLSINTQKDITPPDIKIKVNRKAPISAPYLVDTVVVISITATDPSGIYLGEDAKAVPTLSMNSSLTNLTDHIALQGTDSIVFELPQKLDLISSYNVVVSVSDNAFNRAKDSVLLTTDATKAGIRANGSSPLAVYPNPTQGQLNILCDFGTGQSGLVTGIIELSDLQGRVVSGAQSEMQLVEERSTLFRYRLDLTAGIYFYSFEVMLNGQSKASIRHKGKIIILP